MAARGLSPEDAAKAAPALAALHSSLLLPVAVAAAAEGGGKSEGRRSSRGCSLSGVAAALRSRPELVKAYAAAATSSPALAAAVARAAATTAAGKKEEGEGEVPAGAEIAKLLDAALAARDPSVAAASIAALSPAIRAMSVAALASGSLPAAARAVKRSAEAGLAALAALLRATSAEEFDLGAPGVPASLPKELVDAAIPGLRAPSAAVVAAAEGALAALAARVNGGRGSDSAAAAAVAATFADAILSALGLGGDASQQKPRAATERAALARGAMALSPVGKAAPEVAARVVAALAAAAEAEANDDARREYLFAACAWARSASASGSHSSFDAALPPALLSTLASFAAVSGKEGGAARADALRGCARLLLAPSSLLASSAKASAAAALLAPLSKAAAEGSAKPAGRADGIAAAAAGVAIVESLLEGGSGHDGGSGGKEDTSALRSTLSPADGSECSLLSPLGLSKLSVDDAELAAALCGGLLRPKMLKWLSESAAPSAPSDPAAAAAAARALAALALHSSAKVRRAALSSIRVAVLSGAVSGGGDEGRAAGLLLEALWLWQGPGAAGGSGRAPGSAEGGEGPAAVPAGDVEVADRIQAALRSLLVAAVVSGGEEKPSLSPASAARLLLVAHHPTAAAARRGGAGSNVGFTRASSPAWKAVVGGKSLGKSKKALSAVASALAADPRAAVAVMMEAAGGDDAGARAAALGALPAAVSAADVSSSSASSPLDSLWRALVAALAAATDRTEHDALTDDEVKIFHTTEGELALEAKVNVPTAGTNGFSSRGGAVAIGKRAADSGKVSTAAAATAAPSRSSSSSKPLGKPGSSSSLGVKKDAAAIWLEEQLEAEAAVRERVAAVATSLARGLASVGAVAGGSPSASSGRLNDLSPLVTPLLSSRVVAGEARDAAVGLATAALRTTATSSDDGKRSKTPSFVCAPAGIADALALAARGGAVPGKGTQAMRAIVSLGKAAAQSSSSSSSSSRASPPLPRPAAALLLPALAHVLRSKPAKGSVSAASMQAAALDAAEALARDYARGNSAGEFARVLYAALEKMPGEGDRLAPLLAELATRGGQSGGGGGGDGTAGAASAAAFGADASLPSSSAAPSSSSTDERGLAGMLAGLRSGAPAVRRSALTALASSPALSSSAGGGVASLPVGAAATLWAARWDPDAANAAAARAAWDAASGGGGGGGSSPPAGLVEPLVAALSEAAASGERADLVTATAAGIADYLLRRRSEDDTCDALDSLLALGSSSSSPVEGSGEEEDARRRRAAARALGASAGALSLGQAAAVVEWLLGGPIADEDAGESWVEAGSCVVRGAGSGDAAAAAAAAAAESPNATAILEAAAARAAERLIPVIEAGVAAASRTTGGDEHAADALRAGGAALLGAAAAGLPKGDARVSSVANALLGVLKVPSAAVQRTAADALPALVPRLAGGEQAQRQLVESLLRRATAGRDYGERRGGALGAAAAVKGAGLSSVNGFGVLAFVKGALADEKDAKAREGGALLFEALAERLGRLFEPYVVSLLPALLDRLADTAAPAREAAEAAARCVTAGLTSQGVKMCLPSLLDAAAPGRAWRTQAGAISALGAMAHCTPRQLAAALPVVVPRLSDALADPHPKVSAAARGALQEVGSVVRNPEVRALAPALLSALAETGPGAAGDGGGAPPGGAGVAALDALLATTFVNAVDAASLALVAPVLLRGLRDRSGDAKQRAARVAGAMACLVAEPKDIEPYVPLLLPALRGCLADPLPAVRAAAARALGSLLRGVGEGGGLLADLLPGLMDSLHAGASSVERSGAAQGLAEVLAVLGPEHAEALLPSVLAGCRSKSPAAREGSLALFRFLPSAMPAAFRAHLDQTLPAVLGGLADDSEGVRSAALAAARTAVDLYASEELEALLPAVESGAAAAN